MKKSKLKSPLQCLVVLAIASPLSAAHIRPDNVTSPRYESVAGKAQLSAVGSILRSGTDAAAGSTVMLSSTIGVTSKQLLNRGEQYVSLGETTSRILRWAGEEKAQADLAVFELEAPIADALQFPDLYRQSDELGKNMTYVGYSFGGNAGARDVPIKFQNTFDAYGLSNHGGDFNNVNMLAIDLDVRRKDLKQPGRYHRKSANLPGGLKRPRKLEGITSFGEYGGGAFVRADGEWQLAGIASFYDNTDSLSIHSAGDTSSFTRISPFADWIDGYLEGQGSWSFDSGITSSVIDEGLGFDSEVPPMRRPLREIDLEQFIEELGRNPGNIPTTVCLKQVPEPTTIGLTLVSAFFALCRGRAQSAWTQQQLQNTAQYL